MAKIQRTLSAVVCENVLRSYSADVLFKAGNFEVTSNLCVHSFFLFLFFLVVRPPILAALFLHRTTNSWVNCWFLKAVLLGFRAEAVRFESVVLCYCLGESASYDDCVSKAPTVQYSLQNWMQIYCPTNAADSSINWKHSWDVRARLGVTTKGGWTQLGASDEEA